MQTVYELQCIPLATLQDTVQQRQPYFQSATLLKKISVQAVYKVFNSFLFVTVVMHENMNTIKKNTETLLHDTEDV